MSHFEGKYIDQTNIRFWKRFIDDIFSIFEGTEPELLTFLHNLNTVHPSIKFTWEYSKTEVVFLDTTVYAEGGKLLTKLYSKPTDSHSYLMFDSCHPEHNKTSIPYSQFLRLRRNNSKFKDFAIHGMHLFNYLLRRGYPADLLVKDLLKVSSMSRESCLQNQIIEKKPDSLYCIVTFNPTNPPVKWYIESEWPLLGRSAGTIDLLTVNRVYGFRRPPSLLDKLCRARVAPRPTIAHLGCTISACHFCIFINTQGYIKSTTTGRKYRIPSKVTCKSENLVYAIECTLCKKQYVGQTMGLFRLRLYGHKSTIKLQKDTAVARHFNQHGLYSPMWNLYILQLISGVGKDTKSKRLKIERQWMSKLSTFVPNGINIMDG
jgi:hypothetical protein